jgi:hypothetical protein
MSSPTKSRRRANAISNFVAEPAASELMSPPLSSPPSASPSATSLPSLQRKTRSTGKEAFSKRPTKSNPLTNGKGDGRETRRKLFLKKIREDRDEAQWQRRMENGGEEEILRVMWVEEERARLERRRMEAEIVGFSLEGIDDEGEGESYGMSLTNSG